MTDDSKSNKRKDASPPSPTRTTRTKRTKLVARTTRTKLVSRHSAALRIQTEWRSRAHKREGVLTCAYIPRNDRICISGHLFDMRALREYMQRTGDSAHPVTRVPYDSDTLRALGCTRAQLRRIKRKHKKEMDERASMHRMALDEFKSTLANGDFNFAAFIIFCQAYMHLMHTQHEPPAAHIHALYHEMERVARTANTPAGDLTCAIARTILMVP